MKRATRQYCEKKKTAPFESEFERRRGVRRPKAPRTRSKEPSIQVLLAHEEEPVPGVPGVAEPVAVQEAPTAIAEQHRDIAVVVIVERRGAQSHDPKLALEIGMLGGEGERFLVGCDAITVCLGPVDDRFARHMLVELMDEEVAIAGSFVHVLAGLVILPGTTVEETGDALLSRELPLEILDGWERRVVDMDGVVTID